MKLIALFLLFFVTHAYACITIETKTLRHVLSTQERQHQKVAIENELKNHIKRF